MANATTRTESEDREHDAAARMPQENDQSDDDQGDAGGERDGDHSDEGEEHVQQPGSEAKRRHPVILLGSTGPKTQAFISA